jgi:hypothetical protein
VHLGRVAGQRHHVVTVARPGDGQRRDLIETGIAGVHRQRQRIAAELALQRSRQVLDQTSLLFVHGVARAGNDSRWFDADWSRRDSCR